MNYLELVHKDPVHLESQLKMYIEVESNHLELM